MAKTKTTTKAEINSVYTLKADPTYNEFWSIFKGKKRIFRKRSKETCEAILSRLQAKELAKLG